MIPLAGGTAAISPSVRPSGRPTSPPTAHVRLAPRAVRGPRVQAREWPHEARRCLAAAGEGGKGGGRQGARLKFLRQFRLLGEVERRDVVKRGEDRGDELALGLEDLRRLTCRTTHQKHLSWSAVCRAQGPTRDRGREGQMGEAAPWRPATAHAPIPLKCRSSLPFLSVPRHPTLGPRHPPEPEARAGSKWAQAATHR